MYVCMHVCMHVYMYVCLYVGTYVWMYSCMHICMDVCVHVCMYACMDGWTWACTYVRTYICAYVRKYVHTYLRMYVCMCMHIHTCTYVYVYIYRYFLWQVLILAHSCTESTRAWCMPLYIVCNMLHTISLSFYIMTSHVHMRMYVYTDVFSVFRFIYHAQYISYTSTDIYIYIYVYTQISCTHIHTYTYIPAFNQRQSVDSSLLALPRVTKDVLLDYVCTKANYLQFWKPLGWMVS